MRSIISFSLITLLQNRRNKYITNLYQVSWTLYGPLAKKISVLNFNLMFPACSRMNHLCLTHLYHSHTSSAVPNSTWKIGRLQSDSVGLKENYNTIRPHRDRTSIRICPGPVIRGNSTIFDRSYTYTGTHESVGQVLARFAKLGFR